MLILALHQPAPIQAKENVTSIRLPVYELYAPAKVVISFAYTKNVTIQVSTLKTSLYKATTSPVQVEFQAMDVDLYSVAVKVLYENITVRQTIQFAIFEGDRPAKGFEFDVASQGIVLDMKLSVVKQPQFPTAEEIGEVLWRQWHSELATFEARQQQLVSKLSDTAVTTGSLAAIAFGICVALILVVFRIYRRVAELSEWGIRHEEEHR
jgi:hypothetical protein